MLFSVHVQFVFHSLFVGIQISTRFCNSSDLLGIVMCAREELHQLIMPRMQKSVLGVFVSHFTETVLVSSVVYWKDA